MPKFKAYVKVPADSKGSLKRIVTKTISADNSVNALAQLRGQINLTHQRPLLVFQEKIDLINMQSLLLKVNMMQVLELGQFF